MGERIFTAWLLLDGSSVFWQNPAVIEGMIWGAVGCAGGEKAPMYQTPFFH